MTHFREDLIEILVQKNIETHSKCTILVNKDIKQKKLKTT